MTLAKKPTLVKSTKAQKFVDGAASHPKPDGPDVPTRTLGNYSQRMDESIIHRAKVAAAGSGVTMSAFVTTAILDKVKKYEAGE